MSKREAVSFTNDLGQVINPGDEVVVVTETYKTVSVRKGTFLGWSEAGNLQVRVPERWGRGEWVDKRTGETGSYSKIPQEHREYRIKPKGTYIATLQRNRIYKLAA